MKKFFSDVLAKMDTGYHFPLFEISFAETEHKCRQKTKSLKKIWHHMNSFYVKMSKLWIFFSQNKKLMFKLSLDTILLKKVRNFQKYFTLCTLLSQIPSIFFPIKQRDSPVIQYTSEDVNETVLKYIKSVIICCLPDPVFLPKQSPSHS